MAIYKLYTGDDPSIDELNLDSDHGVDLTLWLGQPGLLSDSTEFILVAGRKRGIFLRRYEDETFNGVNTNVGIRFNNPYLIGPDWYRDHSQRRQHHRRTDLFTRQAER